jgi:CBS domain-containing protein
VADLAELIAQHDPRLEGHQVAFMTSDGGLLAGVITRSDVLKAIEEGHSDWAVMDVGSTHAVVTTPDETVFDALSKITENDIGRLPVVERNSPGKVVGYLGRAGVLLAWGRRYHDEHVREPGMLDRAVGR